MTHLDREEAPGQPACPGCGGRLFPTVVNFGDPLPAGDLSALFHNAERCDLFVVLGSSLVVSPSADQPG